ncbi:unnamed protein product [Cuscuta epithymum]|uniref:MATH domain-containing protein n=2 Tax=Cuscuta epithymum TaxID=186058 RepID=A0AAV0EJW3_9ASTE|nr:unnamed protein product [Cuscuta epithymum]
MSKFTWRIENFSRLGGRKHYSVIFVVNDYKWKLRLCPNGNSKNKLNLYLLMVDSSSLPRHCGIGTIYSLALINQIDNNKTIKKESYWGHIFSRRNNFGCCSFIPLKKFYDKSEGYLVDDTCLFEAELSVITNAFAASHDNCDQALNVGDHVESAHVEARLFLESLTNKPSSSFWESNSPTHELSLLKGHDTSATIIFDMLISTPLDILVDPRNETAILESLSAVINHNLHLFSDGQAKEIMNLKTTFPQLMQECRSSVEIKRRSEHPSWSTLEKTRSLLEDFVKTGEGIRAEVEELNNKKKEMEAQLKVIKSNSLHVKEERIEVSRQMEFHCSLAMEQAAEIVAKDAKVNQANKKLEHSLKSKWAATRDLFS